MVLQPASFREVIPFGASLRYAGRPASASPAVGYMSVHQKQQQDLVIPSLPYYASLGLAYSAELPAMDDLKAEAKSQLEEIIKN